MKYYVAPVSEYINDGNIQKWIDAQAQLVVCDPDHLSEFNKRIKEQLLTLRPELMMVAETDYVDAVYRNSYYSYFATKLKSYRRYCIRLSFFEPCFSSIDQYFNLGEQDIQNCFLGFLVLRPIGKCIGRNAISPKAKNPPISDVKVCLAEINSTCMGVKLKVNAFPHSSQDGEYMTCAETTTWALMEYFGNKYVLYNPLLPSELLASLQSHAVERLVPSQGLSIQQISMALRQQNFGCKMYSNSNPRFKEIMTCYVESGLPLAVAVQGGEIGHAIVCIGRANVKRGDISSMKKFNGTDYYFWNESIDEFVFNDDNKPGYQLYRYDTPTPYFGKMEITHFIVPLHKKIYLAAEQAIDISNFLVDKDFHASPNSVIRTFLTSSRSYREYIWRNPDLSQKLKLAYLTVDLPKFIWVTEVSSRSDFDNSKVNSLILLDATSTYSDGDPYASLIFKQNCNQITIYDKKMRSLRNLVVTLPPKFESFNGNLA